MQNTCNYLRLVSVDDAVFPRDNSSEGGKENSRYSFIVISYRLLLILEINYPIAIYKTYAGKFWIASKSAVSCLKIFLI